MDIQNDFEFIPILDYALTKTKKSEFLKDLQYALVHVGFLYLTNPPIEQGLVDKMIAWAPKVFDIPMEDKLKIEMKNSPHFVGYSRQGNEITKYQKDNREQYDFGTETTCSYKEGDPIYWKLCGENQWPSETVLPGFKNDLIAYFDALTRLSYEMMNYIAQALELPSNAFEQFYEKPIERQYHRMKIVKYPAVDQLSLEGGNQGVGPHYDSWFTLLLQGNDVPGLQVQNRKGQWIDVTPIQDTFVVNIGKGLEAVTQGVCIATTHRVLNPPSGWGPRFSLPWFQMVGHEAHLGDMVLDIPQHILDRKNERGVVTTDSVNYAEISTESNGYSTLINRIKSHPDVGLVHYPDLYKEIFPNGHIGQVVTDDDFRDMTSQLLQDDEKVHKDQPLLRIRLLNIDTYQGTPGLLDRHDCPFTPPGTQLSHVPIIRVFGVTDGGQKVCCHVHQIYPYCLVEYNGSLEPDVVNKYIYRLGLSINYAMAVSLQRNPLDPKKGQFVAAILLCKGTPFYGFHVGYRFYLKIYALDPRYMSQMVTLLQSGGIMRTLFQPYEAHIPYLLQFFIDYNLFGCGWMEVKECIFREPLPPDDHSLPYFTPENICSSYVGLPPQRFTESNVPSHRRFPASHRMDKISYCTLELDITGSVILNRQDLKPRFLHHEFVELERPLPKDAKFVPSVNELWKDEMRRRRMKGMASNISVGPSSGQDPRDVIGENVWYEGERLKKLLDQIIDDERNKTQNPDLSLSHLIPRNEWEEYIMTVFETTETMVKRENTLISKDEEHHHQLPEHIYGSPSQQRFLQTNNDIDVDERHLNSEGFVDHLGDFNHQDIDAMDGELSNDDNDIQANVYPEDEVHAEGDVHNNNAVEEYDLDEQVEKKPNVQAVFEEGPTDCFTGLSQVSLSDWTPSDPTPNENPFGQDDEEKSDLFETLRLRGGGRTPKRRKLSQGLMFSSQQSPGSFQSSGDGTRRLDFSNIHSPATRSLPDSASNTSKDSTKAYRMIQTPFQTPSRRQRTKVFRPTLDFEVEGLSSSSGISSPALRRQLDTMLTMTSPTPHSRENMHTPSKRRRTKKASAQSSLLPDDEDIDVTDDEMNLIETSQKEEQENIFEPSSNCQKFEAPFLDSGTEAAFIRCKDSSENPFQVQNNSEEPNKRSSSGNWIFKDVFIPCKRARSNENQGDLSTENSIIDNKGSNSRRDKEGFSAGNSLKDLHAYHNLGNTGWKSAFEVLCSVPDQEDVPHVELESYAGCSSDNLAKQSHEGNTSSIEVRDDRESDISFIESEIFDEPVLEIEDPSNDTVAESSQSLIPDLSPYPQIQISSSMNYLSSTPPSQSFFEEVDRVVQANYVGNFEIDDSAALAGLFSVDSKPTNSNSSSAEDFPNGQGISCEQKGMISLSELNKNAMSRSNVGESGQFTEQNRIEAITIPTITTSSPHGHSQSTSVIQAVRKHNECGGPSSDEHLPCSSPMNLIEEHHHAQTASCEAPLPSDNYLARPGHMNDDFVDTDVDGLTSCKTLVWKFACPAPHTRDLIASLDEFGIPHIIYQDAYYSYPADVPAHVREYAGKNWKFDALGWTTTADFDNMTMLKVDDDLLKPQQYRINRYEFGQAPPSKISTLRWLKSENEKKFQKKSSNFKDHKSQDAGSYVIPPTQSNRYGFKYTPTRSIMNPLDKEHMSVFALECHVITRGKLMPNPDEDEIAAVFYCLQTDDEDAGYNGLRDNTRVGVITQQHENFHVHKLGFSQYDIQVVDSELELINAIIGVIRTIDPEIITGYEIQSASWGFLIERAKKAFDYDLVETLARVRSQSGGYIGKENDRWGYTHNAALHITGRHALNIWRIMKGEVALTSYSFENVAYHVLHERTPHYSYQTLTEWSTKGDVTQVARVYDYYFKRVQMDIGFLEETEFVSKTSEFARIFGVDFFSVVSRGSQYKVESMLLRITKPESFVLISPSRAQVGKQNAAECLPLVMEPQSAFYNSPLVVLDFQSLYPSCMIAYNLCYSTCLGRVGTYRGEHKLGVSELHLPSGLLEMARDHIFIAPNGFMYAKSSLRRSCLSKLLTDLLDTRIMVKNGMKLHNGDRSLMKLLNARQLGLKYIANVTYGYTAATFSGRMPCVEIADSIVQTGRETLERAIEVIQSNEKWGAEVVYGDTDSLFVYLRGKSKQEAFEIGHEIANTITQMNPRPIRLKFEKVYLPSVLLAKKRYVGFKYEDPQQQQPKFDAKGIETVRRDGTPAGQKILENSLKILFRTSDLSKVKEYCQKEWTKLMEGRVSIQDFIFAKEVKLGTYSEKGPPPPGALISARKMVIDPRAEPQYGERVPYVIVHGAPGDRLIDQAVSPEVLLFDRSLRLHATYYINKHLIPILSRVFNLVGADVKKWFSDMAKPNNRAKIRIPSASQKMSNTNAFGMRSTLDRHFQSQHCVVCRRLTEEVICQHCLKNVHNTCFNLAQVLRQAESKLIDLEKICQMCSGTSSKDEIKCDSMACPVYFARVKAKHELDDVRGIRRLIDRMQYTTLEW